MNRIVLCMVALAVVAFAVGCASQGGKPAERIAAVKALDKQTVDAFNARDVDAIMAVYWNSPNLVYYPFGALEIRGWDAVKADVAKMFSTMPASVTIETVDTNYKVAGDVVISWGLWRTRMTLADGQSTSMDGRGMGVAAKRDGKWVYILDHASVPYGVQPKVAGGK